MTAEKATIEDLNIQIEGTDAQLLIDSINKYLSVFAKPINLEKKGFVSGSCKCLQCESVLDGVIGSFTWGLTHGEGVCSKCGWPCRAYHRPEDENGELFTTAIEKILQYHPDGVSFKS